MSILNSTEWILVLVCFLGSFISVSIGTSCGLLLAVMVTVLPPTAALPLHGLIEGLSSGIRWMILRQHVNYRYLFYFVIGGVLGLLIGWPLIGLFSEQALTLVLGLFLLLTLWVPLAWLKLPAFAGGAGTSCLSVLVGATGPLVAALLSRNHRDHRTVVSTQGACTVFQHWGKVLVFIASGFSFAYYWQLVVALCVATVVGTLAGRCLLSIVPPRFLRIALRSVVSLLGIRLILMALNVHVANAPIVSLMGVVVLITLAMTSGYIGYKLGYRQRRH